MARLLVFGRSGQVAQAIAARAAAYGFEPVLVGRERLDLAVAGEAEIGALIEAARPDAAVNAAAYTHVDRAEAEPDACARLNRDAPAALARACHARGLPFVHFSTDYVFDGEKGAPYVEDDPPRPLGVYGRAKADGEAALAPLLGEGARLAVVRSSWVFSAGGANFLRTMLRLAGERDEIGVVDDQHGRPTPASGCAEAALELAGRMLVGEAGATGLFHAAGADAMSWADFADRIFDEARRRGRPAARVRRITTAEYPTAAPRPRDTRLCCARLESTTGWRAPDVARAISDCLAELESVP